MQGSRSEIDLADLCCHRCGRALRDGNDQDLWNAEMRRGVMVFALCPTCQTSDENAEATIRVATLDYGIDGRGRAPLGRKGQHEHQRDGCPGLRVGRPGGGSGRRQRPQGASRSRDSDAVAPRPLRPPGCRVGAPRTQPRHVVQRHVPYALRRRGRRSANRRRSAALRRRRAHVVDALAADGVGGYRILPMPSVAADGRS